MTVTERTSERRVEPAAGRARRRSLRRTAATVAGQAALIIVVGAVWEYVARSGLVDEVFVGEPSQILKAFWNALGGDLLRVDAVSTTLGWFIGWSAASVLAIIAAFGVSRSPYLRRVLEPLTVAVNGLPRVALAPLFILWFGIGLTSKVVLAASVAFFVVFANTLAGIDGVDQDQLLLARVMGARPRQVFRYFILPSAIPTIFAGLELGAIFAMLATVSGEMIAGDHGLGVKLQYFASQFQTNDYFATLLLLMLITTVLTQVLRLLRRRLLAWQTVGTTDKD